MSDSKNKAPAILTLGSLIVGAAAVITSLDLTTAVSHQKAPLFAALTQPMGDHPEQLRVIGPTANVQLAISGSTEAAMPFLARVDTGAKACSIHASAWSVVGGLPSMEDNLGKTVQFKIENRRGETQWLERKIAEVAVIRTSEREETRYKIPMQITCQGVVREVLVSLNDRSQMTYAFLLGRNFLDGEFLVDVTGADVEDDLLAGGDLREQQTN